MLEENIEAYFRKQVEAHGGLCEKFAGAVGRPDRICTWRPAVGKLYGEMDLVELKKPGKKPRASQDQDHKRRAKRLVPVYLIDTKEKVDEYVGYRSKYGFAPSTLFAPVAAAYLAR